MKGPLQPAVGPRPPDARAAPHRRIAHWIILVWTILVAPLEFWGLPASSSDPTLFYGGQPWSAEQYRFAEALDDFSRHTGGADVDINAHADPTDLTNLTSTPAQRAEILRRFRLYTRQPDEMITFRALQKMNPRAGDFDPQMYQYGGGYIYSVGAMIGAGMAVGYVPRASNADEFVLKPERFARYYVVSRFFTLGFAVIALLGVVRVLVLLGRASAAPLAVLLLACSPLFLSTATEAKPHLPSAALIAWSAVALLQYERRGRRSWALLGGALAGLAFAFVLTGLAGLIPIAALLPFTRKMQDAERARRRLYASDLLLALLLGVCVFAALNPYLLYNVAADRGAASGNLSNSIAMYAQQFRQFGAGALRTLVLLHEGAGWLTPLAGLCGLLLLSWQKTRAAVILAAPAVAILLLACFLAAHKPAEFARFLLIPTMALCVGAALLISYLKLIHPALPWTTAILLICLTRAPAYAWSLAQDVRGTDSRVHAAAWLLDAMDSTEPLGVLWPPAPYSLPPVDLHRREIILLPAMEPIEVNPDELPEWLVYLADDARDYANAWWHHWYEPVTTFPRNPWYSRITWANKPVFVYRMRGTPEPMPEPLPPPVSTPSDEPLPPPVVPPATAPQSAPATQPAEDAEAVG